MEKARHPLRNPIPIFRQHLPHIHMANVDRRILQIFIRKYQSAPIRIFHFRRTLSPRERLKFNKKHPCQRLQQFPQQNDDKQRRARSDRIEHPVSHENPPLEGHKEKNDPRILIGEDQTHVQADRSSRRGSGGIFGPEMRPFFRFGIARIVR